VPKVFAVRRADGGAHTVTSWTMGVRTLLAPTDVLVLVELVDIEDREPTMTWVRWDVAAAVCADTCWEVMDQLTPPRVLALSWPSPEQLALLKDRQLPPS
jgi:hypothetical protein